MSGDCLPMMLSHAAARAVEAHVRMVVTDVEDGLAHQRLDIHQALVVTRPRRSRCRSSPGVSQATAGARIGCDDRIENGIGDLIGTLSG